MKSDTHKNGWLKFIGDRRGFTLVEIIIVVGILALLTAIVVPNILRSKVNANHTRAQATLRSISSALEMYYNTNQAFPTDTDDLITGTPPYLNNDYFTATYKGYDYTAVLTQSTYFVSAVPTGPNQGLISYQVVTGGVLSEI
ncbi:MAG: type II secretion system protein G [Lysobacterales bacterium]|jgi:type II secretion system protein G